MRLLRAKSTDWLKRIEKWKRNLLLTGIAGIGGLLYFRVWLPLTGIGIPCFFHELTGLFCPGCGMTRLVLALMEADVPQAFRYNMLVFLLAPLVLIYLLLVWKGKARPAGVLMGMMVGMTIAFGVLRNVPAFSWMAPVEL